MKETTIQRDILARATSRYVVLFKSHDATSWHKGYLTLVINQAHLWDAYNRVVTRWTILNHVDMGKIKSFLNLTVGKKEVRVVKRISLGSTQARSFPTQVDNIPIEVKKEKDAPSSDDVVMPEPRRCLRCSVIAGHNSKYEIEWSDNPNPIALTKDQLYCHPMGAEIHDRYRLKRNSEYKRKHDEKKKATSTIDVKNINQPPPSFGKHPAKVDIVDLTLDESGSSTEEESTGQKPPPKSVVSDPSYPDKKFDVNSAQLYQMTINDVYSMIKSHVSEKYAQIFKEHEVDGPALSLLNVDIMSRNMGITIGPVVKINELILVLKANLKN